MRRLLRNCKVTTVKCNIVNYMTNLYIAFNRNGGAVCKVCRESREEKFLNHVMYVMSALADVSFVFWISLVRFFERNCDFLAFHSFGINPFALMRESEVKHAVDTDSISQKTNEYANYYATTCHVFFCGLLCIRKSTDMYLYTSTCMFDSIKELLLYVSRYKHYLFFYLHSQTL